MKSKTGVGSEKYMLDLQALRSQRTAEGCHFPLIQAAIRFCDKQRLGHDRGLLLASLQPPPILWMVSPKTSGLGYPWGNLQLFIASSCRWQIDQELVGGVVAQGRVSAGHAEGLRFKPWHLQLKGAGSRWYQRHLPENLESFCQSE